MVAFTTSVCHNMGMVAVEPPYPYQEPYVMLEIRVLIEDGKVIDVRSRELVSARFPGQHHRFPGHHVIRLKTTKNPKLEGSQCAARYDLHVNGQRVDDYIALCKRGGWPIPLAHSDLRWNVEHGFMDIIPPND